MNRPEPIELENNLGPDAVTGEINRVPWKAYDVDEMDIYIAEKDKEIAELKAALERDFVVKKSAEKVLRDLLDCGLIKEWFYNGTFHAVLKADDPHLEIAELKAKLEDAKASAYAEMVDAGMRERRLKVALWLARGYIMTLLHRDFLRLAYQCNSDDYKNELVRRRNRYYDLYEKCIKKAEEYK